MDDDKLQNCLYNTGVENMCVSKHDKFLQKKCPYEVYTSYANQIGDKKFYKGLKLLVKYRYRDVVRYVKSHIDNQAAIVDVHTSVNNSHKKYIADVKKHTYADSFSTPLVFNKSENDFMEQFL